MKLEKTKTTIKNEILFKYFGTSSAYSNSPVFTISNIQQLRDTVIVWNSDKEGEVVLNFEAWHTIDEIANIVSAMFDDKSNFISELKKKANVDLKTASFEYQGVQLVINKERANPDKISEAWICFYREKFKAKIFYMKGKRLKENTEKLII